LAIASKATCIALSGFLQQNRERRHQRKGCRHALKRIQPTEILDQDEVGDEQHNRRDHRGGEKEKKTILLPANRSRAKAYAANALHAICGTTTKTVKITLFSSARKKSILP
jgi:hypothetical protein